MCLSLLYYTLSGQLDNIDCKKILQMFLTQYILIELFHECIFKNARVLISNYSIYLDKILLN